MSLSVYALMGSVYAPNRMKNEYEIELSTQVSLSKADEVEEVEEVEVARPSRGGAMTSAGHNQGWSRRASHMFHPSHLFSSMDSSTPLFDIYSCSS